MPNKTPDLYVYAREILSRHLDHFLRERGDVCRQEGIEPLHRMRVASRRLRAALRVFRELLPPRKTRKWRQHIRRTGRLLGRGRQLDIQLRFLEKAADEITARPHRENIRILTRMLEKRRLAVQEKIGRELTSGRMKRHYSGLEVYVNELESRRDKQAAAEFREHRDSMITERISQLLRFRAYVNDPAKSRELHLLRIAAKNLRYTLEISRPWYGAKTDRLIRASRNIQDRLGDLHELDVLLEFLAEAAETRGKDKRFRGTIIYLERKYAVLRGKAYKEFKRLWERTPLARATPPKITALSPN
jgi:CHAD domain-containing protein